MQKIVLTIQSKSCEIVQLRTFPSPENNIRNDLFNEDRPCVLLTVHLY